MFCIREEACPFLIPDSLKKVLLGYPLETGAGGGIGNTLPAMMVWSIINASGILVGHVWINQQHGPQKEIRPFINFAVYDDERSNGAARQAIGLVEDALRTKGVFTIYAQVNSNKPETGLRVRRWLVSEGYGLLREDISRRRESWSDDAIIEGDPCSLKFAKQL